MVSDHRGIRLTGAFLTLAVAVAPSACTGSGEGSRAGHDSQAVVADVTVYRSPT